MPKAFLIRKNLTTKDFCWQPVTPPPSPEEEAKPASGQSQASAAHPGPSAQPLKLEPQVLPSSSPSVSSSSTSPSYLTLSSVSHPTHPSHVSEAHLPLRPAHQNSYPSAAHQWSQQHVYARRADPIEVDGVIDLTNRPKSCSSRSSESGSTSSQNRVSVIQRGLHEHSPVGSPSPTPPSTTSTPRPMEILARRLSNAVEPMDDHPPHLVSSGTRSHHYGHRHEVMDRAHHAPVSVQIPDSTSLHGKPAGYHHYPSPPLHSSSSNSASSPLPQIDSSYLSIGCSSSQSSASSRASTDSPLTPPSSSLTAHVHVIAQRLGEFHLFFALTSVSSC